MTYRARIGYCKLGRSLGFDKDKWGYAGDAEAPNLLMRLARRNPDVEWIVVGRNNQKGGERDLAPNIYNPWADKGVGPGLGLAEKLSTLIGSLDGMVVHAGQHGTSNMSIPQSHSSWEQFYEDVMNHGTKPQDWSITYAGFLVRGLNLLGDRSNGVAPVVWIVTDPRNFLKARDVKWPTGYNKILAQYAFERGGRHERFRDPRLPEEFPHLSDTRCQTDRDNEIWEAHHTYVYGGLELMILPDNWETWGQASFEDRQPAGIASTSFNDGRIGKEPRRSELIRDYLLEVFPGSEVYGKWDPVSLSDVPKGSVIQNDPKEFPELLNRWRTSLTLPALGSSWTVAKPFQLWAGRTVGFFVDKLDNQGWILPSRRQGPLTHSVGDINGTTYYSIRDDWTETDIRLAHNLRVDDVQEYKLKANLIAYDRDSWEAITHAQRDLLKRRWDQALTENMIEDQLKLR